MVDFSAIVTRMLPELRAGSAAELEFWTETEIYDYFNGALDRAWRCGLFPVELTFQTQVNVPEYVLPQRIQAIAGAFADGVYIDTVTESRMDAFGREWRTDAGRVDRVVVDASPTLTSVRLFRIPVNVQTIRLVGLAAPAPVSTAAPMLTLPRWTEDYSLHAALAEAQAKRTDARQPGAAEFSGVLATAILQVASTFYRWDSAESFKR